MLVFAIGAFITLFFVGAVYVLYFFLILKNRNLTAKFQNELSVAKESNNVLAPVSIIVNAFNEEEIIGRKLDNISNLDYPLDKIEVLVIDDASIDGTGDIAKNAMKDLKLSGRVIENPTRLGLNRSLNIAIMQAKNNFVCITDSDVMLEKEALRRSVNVLLTFKNAGGVTGNVQPIFEGAGVAQMNESTYRNFYHKSMLGEASVHSAFPGNGPLIVYDKSLIPSLIPVDYGSTDGNVAMNIIKSGYRFVYIPDAVILESVPENIGQQRLQKVRRAQRLIQVFLHNLDVFLNKKYGKFGQIVFPLKFLMVAVCPLLLVIGLIFFALSVVFSTNLWFQGVSVGGLVVVSCAVLFWKDFSKMFSSFLFHQIYLLVGLFSSVRKSKYWKTIDRKKFGK